VLEREIWIPSIHLLTSSSTLLATNLSTLESTSVQCNLPLNIPEKRYRPICSARGIKVQKCNRKNVNERGSHSSHSFVQVTFRSLLHVTRIIVATIGFHAQPNQTLKRDREMHQNSAHDHIQTLLDRPLYGVWCLKQYHWQGTHNNSGVLLCVTVCEAQ
jgi:hypothetical protein